MDGLINFYSSNRPAIPVMGFVGHQATVTVAEVHVDSLSGFASASCSQSGCETVVRSTPGLPTNSTAQLLARIVLVPLLIDRSPCCLDISEDCYRVLTRTFGLEKCVEYAHSSTATFDIVPATRDVGVAGFHCSIFLPSFFGMYLAYDTSTKLVQGICWAEGKFMPLFRSALLHLKQLAQHAYYALLAASAAFNSFHDHRLAAIRPEVSKVEKKTGYKWYDMIAHDAAEDSYTDLSARLGGYIISLSADHRLNLLTVEVLASTETQASKTSLSSWSVPPILISSFDAHLRTIERRVRVQNTSIDLLITRVNNQLTALFHLTNRSETLLSLEIAKDSRMIASASKRDSSSMKTLAAVTVIFLPGTFVASLFSMSMFDWQTDRAGGVVNSRFWIYWAVAVPLTMVTLCVWIAWTKRRAMLSKSSDKQDVLGLQKAFASRNI